MAQGTITAKQANLRKADGLETCAGCSFWDTEAEWCNTLNQATAADEVCNLWRAKRADPGTPQAQDEAAEFFFGG